MIKPEIWDSIEFWIEFMTPEDSAFLLLFANSLRKPPFKTEVVDGLGYKGRTGEIEDDSTNEFEMCISITENCPVSVWVNGSYSGYWSGGSSGTYWEPPDPGECYLDDITIDSIMVNNDESEYGDAEIDKDLVDKPGTSFTYLNVVALATECVSDKVDGETTKSIDAFVKKHTVDEIPLALQERISEVFEKNYDKIRAKIAGKKFNV